MRFKLQVGLSAIFFLCTVEIVTSNNKNIGLQWDGGCVNRCYEDPEKFCEPSIKMCMDCEEVCSKDSYINLCNHKCEGFLKRPKVTNRWSGCSGDCYHNLQYFCESVTKICMKCEDLCDNSRPNYKPEKCMESCAGYIVVTQPMVSTQMDSPSTKKTTSNRRILIILPISFAVILVVGLLVFWKRNIRIRTDNRPIELENGEGGERQAERLVVQDSDQEAEGGKIAQVSVPYPFQETQIPSPSSNFEEGGGDFPVETPHLREG